ncbi:large conductance mechanosensitive channel protein MscL [Rhabdothermincola sediminis]|uniref:large conductance mechanosensitive channel protein MscL n=1 Tax=Rhabdothermincola sediminis TaxID=2751370 RepID=UPI001AA035F8|nr:large conductance mechanosensitive channel protein MscL [Rhabdothermincola sediminis]
MFKEFKEFIARGNVVDLAVAVVVGAAFTQVVNAFAQGILMQLVAALVDQPDFGALSIRIRDTDIGYGAFINAVINFLIVAVAVFLVVKGLSTLQKLRSKAEEEEQELAETEVQLLTQIRDALVGRES